MPVMIRADSAALDNEQICFQAALLIVLCAVLKFMMLYVAIFLRHKTELAGQRHRDFCQPCFNIEVVFVLDFPPENNFSSPLS